MAFPSMLPTKEFTSSISLPSKTLVPQSRKSVSVTVEIATTTVVKDFTNVQVVSTTPNVSFEEDKVTVLLSLSEDNLDKIEEPIQLSIDTSGLEADTSVVEFTKTTETLFSIVGSDAMDLVIKDISPTTFTLKESQ